MERPLVKIMRSDVQRSNYITNLNLNEVWGRKYFGGKTLKTFETLTIIKGRMKLAPVRKTNSSTSHFATTIRPEFSCSSRANDFLISFLHRRRRKK
jgi:hypothetical protein